MSQVNFVEQFNLIMEYARENCLHGRECMLWLDLFYFANRAATYNAEAQTYEWPDDFFTVSNSELNSIGQFDKRAIEALRNSLKQRGLIDFIKGEKNKRNPAYRFFYLSRVGYKIVPNNTPNIPPNNVPNNVPNNTPNIPPNDVPNHEANHAPRTVDVRDKNAPNTPPIPLNKNNKYKSSTSDPAGVGVSRSEYYSPARARGTGDGFGLVDMDEETGDVDGLVPLPWDSGTVSRA